MNDDHTNDLDAKMDNALENAVAFEAVVKEQVTYIKGDEGEMQYVAERVFEDISPTELMMFNADKETFCQLMCAKFNGEINALALEYAEAMIE